MARSWLSSVKTPNESQQPPGGVQIMESDIFKQPVNKLLLVRQQTSCNPSETENRVESPNVPFTSSRNSKGREIYTHWIVVKIGYHHQRSLPWWSRRRLAENWWSSKRFWCDHVRTYLPITFCSRSDLLFLRRSFPLNSTTLVCSESFAFHTSNRL